MMVYFKEQMTENPFRTRRLGFTSVFPSQFKDALFVPRRVSTTSHAYQSSLNTRLMFFQRQRRRF